MVTNANTALAKYSSASPASGEMRFTCARPRSQARPKRAPTFGLRVAEVVAMTSCKASHTGVEQPALPLSKRILEAELLQIERQFCLQRGGDGLRPAEPVPLAFEEPQVAGDARRDQGV